MHEQPFTVKSAAATVREWIHGQPETAMLTEEFLRRHLDIGEGEQPWDEQFLTELRQAGGLSREKVLEHLDALYARYEQRPR
ncbi:MAG: hypothetical protein C4289_17675, partial [Chloroflexota bacterium]